ncbi:hypothetical protein PC116_g13385 [Phytophthora cactorum]|nr:hypothetical protein Pcac1_g7383 [Phytophthora cactorum]KAG4238596.1 hypothetical protein PC116_g13385 [Phytophthora cactorum]
MDVNAAFVKRIYETVKVSATHREYFVGKKVVIVLDNAPAHNQPEERLEKAIAEHGGLELLRLGPYPPMLSPIEGKSSNDVHATYYSDLTVSFTTLLCSGCF